jgi:hypothetical protein
LPGAGQLYCGRRARGFWTFFWFLLGVLACWVALRSTRPEVRAYADAAYRLLSVIYVFAPIDAYFTAHEVNAGVDPFIVGNNPRVAAAINLMTNGFGYFYLGQRVKGFILAITLGFVSRFTALFGHLKIGLAVWLVLQAISLTIAADAYRLAQKELAEVGALAPKATGSRLPVAIPYAVAALIGLVYFGLFVAAFLLAPSR